MLDKITGEIRVFTKEVKRPNGSVRVIFNACVGCTKLEEGDYINYYMPVNFSNDVKKQVAKVYTQESFDVLIKESWIKAYKDSDENTRPILFINKATIISNDEEPAEKPKKTKSTKTSTKAKKAELEPVEDEELPF